MGNRYFDTPHNRVEKSQVREFQNETLTSQRTVLGLYATYNKHQFNSLRLAFTIGVKMVMMICLDFIRHAGSGIGLPCSSNVSIRLAERYPRSKRKRFEQRTAHIEDSGPDVQRRFFRGRAICQHVYKSSRGYK